LPASAAAELAAQSRRNEWPTSDKTSRSRSSSPTRATSPPTRPRFGSFCVEGIDGTELEWLYNAAPVSGTHYPVGANPIVKDSTGTYHVVWVSRKAERHTGFWAGSGTVNQSSQTTAFVRHSEVAAIDGV
jgi:hypothetical protein